METLARWTKQSITREAETIKKNRVAFFFQKKTGQKNQYRLLSAI